MLFRSFDSIDEGVRSVDGDVQDAAIDAVRVAKNIDSVYGRLGTIITEGAQKLGLKAGNLPKRQIVKLIKDQLQAADRFSAKVGKNTITYEMIDEEGTRLAEILDEEACPLEERAATRTCDARRGCRSEGPKLRRN